MQRLVVVATLVLALLLTGAVAPWERAVVAWGWAVGVLALPTGEPDEGVRAWLRGMGWLLLAGAPGLLWLPVGAASAIAPGLAAFAPPEGFAGLAVASDATVAALVDVGVFGVAGVALAGAMRGLAPDRLARGVTFGAAVIVAVSFLHAALGWTSWMGVIPVRDVDRAFFPPLINPNHTGALLVVTAPYVADVRARSVGRWRLVAGLTLMGIVAFPWIARSMGVAVALVAMGLAAALRQQSRARRWGALSVSVLVAAGLGAVVSATTPRWWELSVAPRLTQWTDTVSLWRAFPWFGVGLGGYGDAYPPWRTVPGFLTFAHAHSDALEWLSETGLWGLVCAFYALRAVWPRPGADKDATATLSAFGLVVAAAVDFPLHIPAVVFVLAALVVSWLEHVDGERLALRVPRTWAVGGVALACAASLLALRAASVAEAVRAPDGAVAEVVLRASPWGEDTAYVWLARAERRTGASRLAALQVAAARAPASGKVARGVAALSAAEQPPPPEADAWLARAMALDPQDLRLWWIAARRRADGGDPFAAAVAAADAFRRWPHEVPTSTAIWEEAWGWLPVGLWWLDALEDAPAHWSARLGWWMLREGDPETALLAMEQAARLRPDVFAHSTTHVDALLALGRLGAARAEAQAWTQAAPEHDWAWVSLASVALSGGDDPLGGAVTVAAWRMAGQPVARRLLFGCIKACEAGRCACDLAAATSLLDAERAQDRGDVERCSSSRDRVRDANPWLRAHGVGLRCGAEARP